MKIRNLRSSCNQMLKSTAILLMCAVSLFSCGEKDVIEDVTGTVLGGYNCASFSMLIQVDKIYPIGKTIEYNNENYQNVIEVQGCLPLPGWPKPGISNSDWNAWDWSEVEPVINKAISFSYRKNRPKKDEHLFFIDEICQAIYAPPNVPRYVITNCQILK